MSEAMRAMGFSFNGTPATYAAAGGEWTHKSNGITIRRGFGSRRPWYATRSCGTRKERIESSDGRLTKFATPEDAAKAAMEKWDK